MNACVLEEWGGSLTVETIPEPEPGPTDVRVDVRACGVTRTIEKRAFDPLLKEFVVEEGALLGSRYATKDEVVRAARLLADGRIDPVVTERVGLEEVPAVHERIRAGESHGMVVLEP